MDIHEYIQILRLRLLDMARASQRGVDYSIKAYKLGNPEFCTHAGDNTYEVNILHREITEMARELLSMELPLESDLRFVPSCERMCHAFQEVHNQAIAVATNSMRLLESGPIRGCRDLITMSDLANSLMRLCVVALFEESIESAQTVLRCDGDKRLFATAFFDWYRTIDQKERAQAGYERAITNHLSHIVHQTHEIADAIVFWLEDMDRESLHAASRRQLIHQEATRPSRGQKEAASSSGMQSFIESIETCFADACFWSRM